MLGGPMSCFTNDASCERIIYAPVSHLNGRLRPYGAGKQVCPKFKRFQKASSITTLSGARVFQ